MTYNYFLYGLALQCRGRYTYLQTVNNEPQANQIAHDLQQSGQYWDVIIRQSAIITDPPKYEDQIGMIVFPGP